MKPRRLPFVVVVAAAAGASLAPGCNISVNPPACETGECEDVDAGQPEPDATPEEEVDAGVDEVDAGAEEIDGGAEEVDAGE